MAEDIQYFYEGISRHGIEKSYRVLAPKDWRLPGAPTQFVVLPWPWYRAERDCLKVVPQSRWIEWSKTISTQPFHNEEFTNYRRMTGFLAKRAQFDGFGRLALSAELLAAAGIDKEADLLGCWDHFEVWDPLKLKQVMPSLMESAVKIKEKAPL